MCGLWDGVLCMRGVASRWILALSRTLMVEKRLFVASRRFFSGHGITGELWANNEDFRRLARRFNM